MSMEHVARQTQEAWNSGERLGDSETLENSNNSIYWATFV